MQVVTDRVFIKGNRRYELVRATVAHKCLECGYPIKPSDEHWSITIGGGGSASLQFPDRKHLGCTPSQVWYEKKTVS